ncbi:acyl carrier protein, mitochondrial-like [Uloborus diversus]|uniref:acyl carrier protein, mitochondrial-like n=1 Tax=Uloborus diversus TaxID=327109 RepID=UPI00240A1A74|nr:acyl carrier protein, mitochondrial-like [Uloborus diversus]
MASALHRMRPIFVKFNNISCKRFNCFPKTLTRTYLISSSNVVNIYASKPVKSALFSDKVFVPSNTCLTFRAFSDDKKLSREEITEKVMDVCKTFDKIPSDKVTLESHFMNDLGLDSLDHVELIMNIEDDFNFEISDADAEKLLRPKDIVEYIVNKEQSNVKQ